jgi:lactate permease
MRKVSWSLKEYAHDPCSTFSRVSHQALVPNLQTQCYTNRTVLTLRLWKPKLIWRFPNEDAPARAPATVDSADTTSAGRAWTPFALLVLFVGAWGVPAVKTALDRANVNRPMPGLDKAIAAAPGAKPIAAVYAFAPLSAAGTAILFAALLTVALLRLPPRLVATAAAETLRGLVRPLLTIACIVGFASVAKLSGMSLTLGIALTAVGQLFPLVAPVVGWLGVFISGSDTASNALFSGMQRATALRLGINPILTVAANTNGGLTAKMISPQSIAVAAGSSGLTGQEGRLFRRTLPHSLALLLVICLLTYLQARFLPGMIPFAASK